MSAIVWTAYPGQSGGQGIADVLFGAYNPGMSFYMYLNLSIYGIKPFFMHIEA